MKSAVQSEFISKYVKEEKEFLEKVSKAMNNSGPSVFFDTSREFTRENLQKRSLEAFAAGTRAGGNYAADAIACRERTLLQRSRTRLQSYGLAYQDHLMKKTAIESLDARVNSLVLDDK